MQVPGAPLEPLAGLERLQPEHPLPRAHSLLSCVPQVLLCGIPVKGRHLSVLDPFEYVLWPPVAASPEPLAGCSLRTAAQLSAHHSPPQLQAVVQSIPLWLVVSSGEARVTLTIQGVSSPPPGLHSDWPKPKSKLISLAVIRGGHMIPYGLASWLLMGRQ